METRRERKKQQTRIVLLRAAAALFAERGIYGTRIEDITERIDLGKGAFYNYFDSKDALLAQLVADGIDTLKRDYFDTLGDHGTPGERIEALVRLHGEFFAAYPHYEVLFHQSRGLLHLTDKRVTQLRAVFLRYLAHLGDALVSPAELVSWSEDEKLDLSAAVAAAIVGYRSFRLAAGLPLREATPADALTAGVPHLLEQRAAE